MSELARLSGDVVANCVRARTPAGGCWRRRGFTIDVDTRVIGYQIRAMVRIRPLPGKLHIVERLIQERPEFENAARSPATILSLLVL